MEKMSKKKYDFLSFVESDCPHILTEEDRGFLSRYRLARLLILTKNFNLQQRRLKNVEDNDSRREGKA